MCALGCDGRGIPREQRAHRVRGRVGSAIILARSRWDTLRFAFQPIVDLTREGSRSRMILARPETGDVLAQAR